MPGPVLILGMHRSGTSAFAGALQARGLELPGAQETGGTNNAKGNRENWHVVVFHELILKRLGGSWDDPPATVTWQPQNTGRANALLEEIERATPSGFKDPRTLLHLGSWKTVCEPVLVGIFRNPAAVARSLAARNAFADARGLELWRVYNERLLDAWRCSPFPLVEFDTEPDELTAQFDAAAAHLGLAGSGHDAAAFFDPTLRHQHPVDDDLPPAVAELYELLLSASTAT